MTRLCVRPRRLVLRGPHVDFEAMAQQESEREDGIEVVSIVTPNHLHAPVAMAFLKKGIHVICDKPLTATLAEAKTLSRIGRGKPSAVFINP